MTSTKTKPLEIFYGGEEYLLDRVRGQARLQKSKDVIFLDGHECSESEVVSALSEVTLDGTEFLVVLDNAEKWKKIPTLTTYLREAGKDPSNVLQVILRTETMPKAWSSLTDDIVEYRKCKSWETEIIKTRITDEAASHNLVLNLDAENLFLKMYSTDLALAASNLRKIKYLGLPSGLVTKEAVFSVCTRHIPVFPWDVSDAALRSPKEALVYATLLFQQEGDEAAIPIVASLMKTIEQVYLARTLYDKGKTSKDMAVALGINPYVFDKKFSAAVKKHNTQNLIAKMKHLCELEISVKGASLAKRVLVEATLHILTSTTV